MSGDIQYQWAGDIQALNLLLSGGYEPNLGDSFQIQIISFGSRRGEFATVNGRSIGNGKQFEVSYSDNGVTLTVVLAP